MFFSRDAARTAVHETIAARRDELTTLSRRLHDGAEPDEAVNQIADVLEAAGFTVQRDVSGIAGTIQAVRERRDTEAERKGLRHAHMAYLADLGSDARAWATEGVNLSLVATLGAAVGLAAALDAEQEYGIVTFMAGPPGWKVEATAKGLVEPFDSALGARTAPAGEGYCYTIDQSGDRLGSLVATVTISGRDADDAREALLSAVPIFQQSLTAPNSMEVADAGDKSIQFELRGSSRSDLIETAVELKDRADAAVADRDATVEFDLGAAIDDMIVNRVLARRVKTYGDTFKLAMDRARRTPPGAPSDWGNVSYVTPAAEIALRITDAPAAVGTSEFSALTARHDAHSQALLLGECMAMTGIDVLRDATYRAIADDQLVKALAARGMSRAHRRWLGVHKVKPPAEGSGGKPRRGPTLTDFRMVRGPGLPPPPPPEEDEENEDEA